MTMALEGGAPTRMPLSLYSWMMDDRNSARWRRLLDAGLGMTHHCCTVRHVEHGVVNSEEDRVEGNHHYHRYRKETPVGSIQRVTLDGWHHEDWLKEPKDYKVRQWIVEHTELVAEYEAFARADAEVGEFGVPVVTGSRTPAMSINVDWAGTQQFCVDVALEVPELFDLYETEKRLFLEETRLIAAGPGRFVKWFENLTIDMIGPDRYRDLLVNVYEEAVPILDAAGKRVMVHYDGGLRVIADDIARAPFHIVESLTEPPEGDMLYDEARAAWPDKVLWGNINVGWYYRPEAELRAAIAAMCARAGRRGFAFEISEDLPRNWEQSIPIMLDALGD
ncbi:MAG TPA: uroporphyrinogen decarboxylase family protein [Candidatus Hydrogenedentes bacterium]|nr:uroporphyrinogen decarboxylase family protein [Candidatus Hydrogenedentota bacterium]